MSAPGFVLAGVGNLGTALLRYNFQKSHNIRITKAYDVDPRKVGQVIGDILFMRWINWRRKVCPIPP